MSTQVILLERIEKLGAMGEIVNVKPGYARNFLLPQNKALRATDANVAYFEAQKSVLEKANEEKKKEAQKHAKTLDGLSIVLVRQASEGGQLYGSVTARDIADAINDNIDQKIERNMVDLNQNYKEIGLFDVIVTLHPEVKETIEINIARTEDEAKEQKKSGKAMIADNSQAPLGADEEAVSQSKEALMDEDALEAEKQKDAEAAAKQAEDDAKEAAKAEKAAAEAAEVEAAADETSEEEKTAE